MERGIRFVWLQRFHPLRAHHSLEMAMASTVWKFSELSSIESLWLLHYRDMMDYIIGY